MAPSAEQRVLRKQTIRDLRVPPGSVSRGLSFVDCKFEGVNTPVELLDARASGTTFVTIERATFTRPRTSVRQLSMAILRDVVIEDWHSGREVVFVRNCLFDRVRLRGFIGDVIVDARLDALTATDLDVALDFYTDVEWALDLREATFGSCELRGVPGDKVLFDPRRHCRVLLDRLRADDAWRDLPDLLVHKIQLWLKQPWSSVVDVAGERSKYFDDWRGAHEVLRKRGYAE